MSKVLIAYVPVLHEGYRAFFAKHHDVECLRILGSDIIDRFRSLVKDIRHLDPVLMKEAIESLNIFKSVKVVSLAELPILVKEGREIIMPDDDVSHELANEFFSNQKIIYDGVFLRWDKKNSVESKTVEFDQKISEQEFDKKMIGQAEREGRKTSDWWRAVGAIVIKDGQVILSGHNRHVPSEHLPYQDGDPRANFNKGVNLEISTALHAEAGLVAEAARRGLSLAGTDIYVTDFPCPPCAKLVAYSGIKKLYYRKGYGVLDGVSILKSQGVKIILVKK